MGSTRASFRLALALPFALSALFILLPLRAVRAQPTAPVTLDEWRLALESGKSARLALPDLVPGSPGARTPATEISTTLRDDIAFAAVFPIVDSRLYPETAALDGASFRYGAWKAAGTDIVVTGSVFLESGELRAEVRIHDVVAGEVAFGTEYRAPEGAERRLAHRIADDFLAKFGLEGIAETRIAFASDRDGDDAHRRAVYRMDYDGAHPERLTNGFLDLAPRWSPDGASLLYVTYPERTQSPQLAILSDEGSRTLIAGNMVFPGSWSPDGSRIAFSSTRDGNAEIYVVAADGTGLRRLTDHPAIDVSPTWSPTGRELAFVSDRSGSPQVYTMDQDGLNVTRVSTMGSYNAEPAWSPSKEFSEIAWASRIDGAVFDVVVLDLLSRQLRKLTSERGLNESPTWAPNGRHLAFSSTRTGESQIFTVNRDGTNLRQLTFEGRNTTPGWSR